MQNVNKSQTFYCSYRRITVKRLDLCVNKLTATVRNVKNVEQIVENCGYTWEGGLMTLNVLRSRRTRRGKKKDHLESFIT